MSQPLPQAARGSAARKAEEKLREIALSFPGAFEDFPWGHRAIKVNKKIFASLNSDRNGFRMSVKLPRSNHSALLLPFSEPTHYGMGKYGWVTASFGIDETHTATEAAPKAERPPPAGFDRARVVVPEFAL